MLSKELFVSCIFHNTEIQSHVTLYGDDSKPQILCLHGLGSTAQETFHFIAPYLIDYFQLVAVDWIGCGKTTRLLGPNDSYSSDYCSEWLTQFVSSATKTGVLREQFTIFAISMSTVSIAKTWQDIGSLIKNIVFVNPLGLDTHINRLFAFILTHPIINHHKLVKLFTNKYIWKYVFGWTENHRQRLLEGLVSGELEVLIRYAKAGILPKGRLMEINQEHSKFEKIDKPILLLCSKRDHVFYKRNYLAFASRRKNWHVVEMDFHNHNLVTSKPKAVADEIQRFLNNNV